MTVEGKETTDLTLVSVKIREMEEWEKLLIYITKKNCATLEEIIKDLGLKEGTAKVYLSRLAQEHIITRRWLRVGGTKKRLYCVNTTLLKELKLS